MLKRRLSELIEDLRETGYRFKSFSLAEEGDYAIDDASWNYKDILHLEHVHGQVRAYPAHVSAEVLATVYHQRILGFRLPLTLVNYVSEPLRQTYLTSFLFFVMIVETRFEAIAPLRTRVVTEYAVGSKPFLLALFFPLFRWAIRRNYRDLMAADVAMRERRGELRRWGYGFFTEGGERGFYESMRLDRQNVRPAPGRRPETPARIRLAELRREGVLAVGTSDHYGVQLAVRDGVVEIYPRLCLHEGACLDVAAPPASGRIVCPWHGLMTPPLASLPVAGEPRAVETRWHRFEIEGGDIVIRFREPAPPAPGTPRQDD